MTLKNLDALVALDATGARVAWVASCASGLSADGGGRRAGARVLAPASADACFSAPHAVAALNSTHFALMDDGTYRKGSKCAETRAGARGGRDFFVDCYSRALVLAIDLGAGTFSRAWSFSYGSAGADAAGDDGSFASTHDMYLQSGGSVVPLAAAPGGGAPALPRMLVAFGGAWPSSTSTPRADEPQQSLAATVLEVDAAGAVRAAAVAPRPHYESGDYRVVPIASLGGEAAEAPFAFEREEDDAYPEEKIHPEDALVSSPVGR